VYLKGEGTFPKTPELNVSLKTPDHIPLATLRPDHADEVVKVEIFYSTSNRSTTSRPRPEAGSSRRNSASSRRCAVKGRPRLLRAVSGRLRDSFATCAGRR